MTYHSHQFDKKYFTTYFDLYEMPLKESLRKPATTFVIKYIEVTDSSWKIGSEKWLKYHNYNDIE